MWHEWLKFPGVIGWAVLAAWLLFVSVRLAQMAWLFWWAGR